MILKYIFYRELLKQFKFFISFSQWLNYKLIIQQKREKLKMQYLRHFTNQETNKYTNKNIHNTFYMVYL